MAHPPVTTDTDRIVADQFLLSDVGNCDVDCSHGQMSLFRDLRSSQFTLVQKDFKNNKVAERNPS